MAVNLGAIRQGIADNAETAAGLESAFPYRPLNAQHGVHLWVDILRMERAALAGRYTIEVEATLLIQGGWDRSRQQEVDDLLVAVWDALESDTTAGASCLVLFVRDAEVDNSGFLASDESGESSTVSIRYEIQVEAA